jgi:hypothetical protein
MKGKATNNTNFLKAQRIVNGFIEKETTKLKKGKTSMPPVSQRKAGQVYPTPKGKMKWTGTGWVQP